MPNKLCGACASHAMVPSMLCSFNGLAILAWHDAKYRTNYCKWCPKLLALLMSWKSIEKHAEDMRKDQSARALWNFRKICWMILVIRNHGEEDITIEMIHQQVKEFKMFQTWLETSETTFAYARYSEFRERNGSPFAHDGYIVPNLDTSGRNCFGVRIPFEPQGELRAPECLPEGMPPHGYLSTSAVTDFPEDMAMLRQDLAVASKLEGNDSDDDAQKGPFGEAFGTSSVGAASSMEPIGGSVARAQLSREFDNQSNRSGRSRAVTTQSKALQAADLLASPPTAGKRRKRNEFNHELVPTLFGHTHPVIWPTDADGKKFQKGYQNIVSFACAFSQDDWKKALSLPNGKVLSGIFSTTDKQVYQLKRGCDDVDLSGLGDEMVEATQALVSFQERIDTHHKSRDSSSLLGVHVPLEQIEKVIKNSGLTLCGELFMMKVIAVGIRLFTWDSFRGAQPIGPIVWIYVCARYHVVMWTPE